MGKRGDGISIINFILFEEEKNESALSIVPLGWWPVDTMKVAISPGVIVRKCIGPGPTSGPFNTRPI